ncbi:MAG: shikimate dehydrogenase [Nocardioides sp.]
MRCAVLGDPIGHSLSPALHRAAYVALGLDWTYDAIRVPSGGLAGFLEGLDDDWRGLSLTMPLKREAMPLLRTRDTWAELAGAANTLLLDDDGPHGLNTDVPGAIAALREATDATVERAVVLGGGATAGSVLLALTELGCRLATLVVRDPARAAETLDAVARHPRAPQVETIELRDLAAVEADVVVSTIPARAQTDRILAELSGAPVVFDVVYDPWPTPLASAAIGSGRVLVGGLDLLLWQAVDQVRAMTGRFDVPVAAMRAAGEAALA